MTEYLFDNSKLRGKIIEKYGTIGGFSEAIGKNRASISLKLNERVSMSREDIVVFSSALGIGNDEIADYFFRHKVVNS